LFLCGEMLPHGHNVPAVERVKDADPDQLRSYRAGRPDPQQAGEPLS